MRHRYPLVFFPVLTLALAAIWPALTPAALAEEVREVVVRNFPEIQEVEGEVAVTRPVPHAQLIRLEDQVVSSTSLAEAIRGRPAAVVETAGFTSAVLSLQGDVRGSLGREGTVGAVLVPDEEPILRALSETGDVLLPLEIEAEVPRDAAYWSAQGEVTVGFPRYRVFLYSTVEKPVGVSLYVYLTH